MLAAGFEPYGPYPGANAPWPGACTTCGLEGSPRYNGVQQGRGPCVTCGRSKSAKARKTPEDVALAVMRDAYFEPSIPYPGNHEPWLGVCLKCGKGSAPTHNAIRSGQGACGYCSKNRVDPAEAYEVMLAAGFEPSIPYPGSKNPWPGVCLKCGKSGAPSYKTLQKGGGACPYCAKRKVDPEDALAVMRAAQFEPSIPYAGNDSPWPGTCLKCGKAGAPSYHSIQSGQGACGYCAKRKVDPEDALALMLEAHFQPVTPYPGATVPWPGHCTRCGKEGATMYNSIQQGQGACGYCAGIKVDPDDALVLMLASGFQPDISYPGARVPWPGRCLQCGKTSKPRYNDVQQGIGACPYCAKRKVDPEDALAVMRAAHFEPTILYPGSESPWPGTCLKCGREAAPRYNSIQRGQGACGYCGKNRVDPAEAYEVMLAAGFEPLIPYPGGNIPWPGTCLKCNREGAPRFNTARSGHGVCPYCMEYGYNPGKPAAFYIVQSTNIVKGGISNYPGKRLEKHSRQQLTEVLVVARDSDGAIPQLIERSWMETVRSHNHNAISRHELPDGYTEAMRRSKQVDIAVDEFINHWRLAVEKMADE